MPESRSAVKLDFTSGLEQLPSRPKADDATTRASVEAGKELGFSGRSLPERPLPEKLDGRSLRSRGANTQLNLKITSEEKALILREATRLIRDPESSVSNIGEFVILAIDFYLSHQSSRARKP